eukprot:TRINITY_DN5192_c0_g2_i1.p1 TRINITY_DN5192_c0_g2~~TRINITY_DN5192_c0_g2_i1.p1  ORF type:complete len:336 (+),score=43.44 TRINITY_DN5192_c0_g2_i1:644-1651(+)
MKIVLGAWFAILLCVVSAQDSSWQCTPMDHVESWPGVVWTRQNCTGQTPKGAVGPIVFNQITANLSAPGVSVSPARADPVKQLQNLVEMSDSVPNAVAGINGGYFWRVDDKSFLDDVCFLKSRRDALEPVSADHPNFGLGDGLLLINGTLHGCNCDCLGYARPAAIFLNGTRSTIDVMSRAEPAPPGVENALAAGPNLVSTDSDTGQSYVNIPLDDLNVNILGHTSNAAIGLVRGASCRYVATDCTDATLVLVTVDGKSGCSHDDPTCGINSHQLAYYMKDAVQATVAMEMDQGGSTTMYVQGQGDNGVVSNPGKGLRQLFSGLFVTFSPSAAEM